MSLKDKLEIGLKPDAPYRQDNLPEGQQADPACQEGATPSDDPAVKAARTDCDGDGTHVADRDRKTVAESPDRKPKDTTARRA